jgi:hypothetical protein
MVIKKYFPVKEPFVRAGIFRTPLISRKSSLPYMFIDEFFAIIRVKNLLAIASIVVMIASGYAYSNM